MKTTLFVGLNLMMLMGLVSCKAEDRKSETAPAGGSELKWLTSFDEAKMAAASRNVPMLVDFSGSDWCGWCIRLDKEVFSTQVFKDYAHQNLVLLLLDFPRSTAQSDDLKLRNSALAEQFKVEGFPTILLLDATGKELARTGYQRGGAEAYVAHLKSLLNKPNGAL